MCIRDRFYPDRMASRILGMGDVLTLIEKAQTEMDEKAAIKTAQRLKENKFDMTDLLEQMKQVKNMGPLSQVLGMIPGLQGKLRDEDTQRGERELQRMEAIINSMTLRERERPDIINPSRKRRIAAGSGTSVEEVNRLLKQFRQMQQMMKQLAPKKGKRRPRMGFPPMR